MIMAATAPIRAVPVTAARVPGHCQCSECHESNKRRCRCRRRILEAPKNRRACFSCQTKLVKLGLRAGPGGQPGRRPVRCELSWRRGARLAQLPVWLLQWLRWRRRVRY
jgi:hypothetical protein